MNRTLFLICILAFNLKAYAEEIFIEKHLGIEFKYESPVSINFNPHEMRKIPIYLNSKFAGGFVASVFPDGPVEEQFMAFGLRKYQSKYGEDNVSFSRKKNGNGLSYYHYIVKAQGVTIEKAIFTKNRESGIKKEGLNVTYTFNYEYSDERSSKLLRNLVESFRLLPNDALYNDALLLSVKKKL